MIEAGQRDPRELVGDMERLLEELEALEDPRAREKATAVVQGMLELYGAGLERIVEVLAARDDGTLAAALADDELVAHLLLLHGLHPEDLQTRILGALAEVRPYLESHGGDVELLAVEGPAVRLRLRGSCSGCPSSTMTLKLAIENAIHKAAPEIEEVVAQDDAPAETGLLQIELSPALVETAAAPGGRLVTGPGGDWAVVGSLPDLADGASVLREVGGQRVLFLRLAGRVYAYRPECPACGDSLEAGRLSAVELQCPGCANRFDVLRAGRCLDSPQLHLEPVPLLEGDDGLVRVALALAV